MGRTIGNQTISEVSAMSARLVSMVMMFLLLPH